MNEIPTAEFLNQLSKEGLESFERDVLNGSLFRSILIKIENAALDGYTGWSLNIPGNEDIRALKVIQRELKSNGFYCEFENKEKVGLLGTYKNKIFHVKWGGTDE